MKDIGTKIKKIRELKGYTQEYLAQELGISQNSYSNIESGTVKLSLNRLEQISHILDVDVIDLLKFDENIIFNNCKNGNIGINSNTVFYNESNKTIQLLHACLEQLTKLTAQVSELCQKRE